MKQIVCDINIHRDSLVTTILNLAGQKQTQTFTNNTPNMKQLKNWLQHNNCLNAVMESTNSYWTTLYTILENADFKPALANTHQVKVIPEHKTNQKTLNN